MVEITNLWPKHILVHFWNQVLREMKIWCYMLKVVSREKIKRYGHVPTMELAPGFNTVERYL